MVADLHIGAACLRLLYETSLGSQLIPRWAALLCPTPWGGVGACFTLLLQHYLHWSFLGRGVCASFLPFPCGQRHWSSWSLAGDIGAQNSLAALVTTLVCAGYGERDVEHWKALCDTVDGCYKSVCQVNPYHWKWLFIPIFYFLCSLLKKSKRSANESGEEHSAKYSNSNNSGNYRERNLLLHSCVSSFVVTVIFCLKRFRITNTLLPKSGTTVWGI